jgi:proteic killer suppression protein
VIVSFGDRATEDLYHGRTTARLRRLPVDVRMVAVRKLDMLNAAHTLDDLKVPPGNRLEALKGALKGKHSIRINDQWRVVFHWDDSGAHEVVVTNYHRG